ncbi:hypothetical protein PsorP6_000093 [Peronosclerospora sorghi]|uniref:Uncharacterized protein n=1 Tax=Peronosclerospora sorghi TaxID=230839 RepID=A0ACC0WWX3_9STRA|nr:hypothetical protein PsorP6_000093 [Peronosclerospora sorghi]
MLLDRKNIARDASRHRKSIGASFSMFRVNYRDLWLREETTIQLQNFAEGASVDEETVMTFLLVSKEMNARGLPVATLSSARGIYQHAAYRVVVHNSHQMQRNRYITADMTTTTPTTPSKIARIIVVLSLSLEVTPGMPPSLSPPKLLPAVMSPDESDDGGTATALDPGVHVLFST